MVHYTTQNINRLKVLESTKRNLCDLLEYAIKLAAMKCGISQVCFTIELDSKLTLIIYLTDQLVSVLLYL